MCFAWKVEQKRASSQVSSPHSYSCGQHSWPKFIFDVMMLGSPFGPYRQRQILLFHSGQRKWIAAGAIVGLTRFSSIRVSVQDLGLDRQRQISLSEALSPVAPNRFAPSTSSKLGISCPSSFPTQWCKAFGQNGNQLWCMVPCMQHSLQYSLKGRSTKCSGDQSSPFNCVQAGSLLTLSACV